MSSVAANAGAAPGALSAVSRGSPGFWASVWARYSGQRLGMAGFAIVFAILVVAFLAPILANEHPLACRYQGKIYAPALQELTWSIPGMRQLLPKAGPFGLVTFDFKRRMEPERGDWAVWTPVRFGPLKTSTRTLEPPSREHWLGTDEVGRDLLARMVYGARVSMMVGFVSIGISTVLGLIVGSLAGYFGSWVDISVSRLIEVVICFPVFFLILTIMSWREPSIWNVMIAIGLVSWTSPARYVRGEFIRLRDMDFTSAATALGVPNWRIILRHILPNALAPVFVTVTFGIAGAILTEAGLSFLGFGVMPPQPSWGNVLRTGFDNMFTSAHMIYPPCVMIFLSVLAWNLVGDSFRDAIDPRIARS